MKRKQDFFFWVGAGFLVLLVILSFVGPHFGGGIRNTGKPYLPPSSHHFLGTDELGRDEFARVTYAARISLTIGFIVQALSLIVGIVVGAIGTFSPKWIRIPVMRFTDGMFAFPDILLAILIVGILETSSAHLPGFLGSLLTSGLLPVIVALSITGWPFYARLVHTQAQSFSDREFVNAAKAMGAKNGYIVRKHIMPQLWGMLLAVAMLNLAGTIIAESTLSFLGIGVLPPTPSWGSMINTAREDMQSHPLWLLWPCLLLSLTIFALNYVGDGLQASFDPKNR